MEVRNFITAREMVDHGHWLTPIMNGEYRLAKPPLPTWITAFFMMIAKTDTNLFFNRLPAGISALMIVFFLFKLVKDIFEDENIAKYSALILSTSYMFMFMARKGTWDIYCHSFMMGGIYFFYKGLMSESKYYKYFILFGIFMGLSWMSKGPVAFYVLLLPFIISLLIINKFSIFRCKIVPTLMAIIICIVISSIWPILIYCVAPEALKAVASQEIHAWSNRHIRPFWYYIIRFPFMAGIWFLPVLVAISKVFDKKKIQYFSPLFMFFIWLALQIILLSIIPEKKVRYLLPTTIPMAVMAAYYLQYTLQKIETTFLFTRIYNFYYLISITGLVITIFASSYCMFRFSEYRLIVVIIALFLNLFLIIKSNPYVEMYKLTMLIFLSFTLILYGIMPLAIKYVKKDSFMDLIRYRNIPELQNHELYMTDVNLKAVWAINKNIKKFDKNVLKKLKQGMQVLLLIKGNQTIEKEINIKTLKYSEIFQTHNQNKNEIWHLYKLEEVL